MPIAPSRATTTARVLVGLTVLCLLLIRLENPAHAESSWVRWEHFVFMPYPPLSRHRRPEVRMVQKGKSIPPTRPVRPRCRRPGRWRA